MGNFGFGKAILPKGRMALAALSTAFLTGSPSGASAAQILQTVIFANDTAVSLGGSVDVKSRVGSLADSYSTTIDLFDPALGTLDSVAISLSGTWTSFASAGFYDPDLFVFTSTAAGLVRLENMRLIVSMPGFQPTQSFANRTATCSRTENAPVPFIPALNTEASCFASLGFNPGSLSPLSSTISDGMLASYTGVGTRAVSIVQNGTVFAQETNGDNGYLSGLQAELITEGRIEVVYNYTPPPAPVAVPEPASWAMMIAGFGLVGGTMRLRRRSVGRAGKGLRRASSSGRPTEAECGSGRPADADLAPAVLVEGGAVEIPGAGL